ncbi:MAG TPA: glycosyltransferase, partial [Steroidobacteraceae bacterium]|nr:glycosyltransferase [Steroidobacteraceae bacterium]
MTTVLIMAGGTGGHVFPALAVARLLRERRCEVVWVGTQRGLEARVVPANGFPIEWLSVTGLRGKGFATWVLAPVRLTVAALQALGILRRRKPAVVLGVGG